MKRRHTFPITFCLLSLFGLGLCALLAPTALAQDGPFDRGRANYCSLGTVKGTYSFTANGYLFPGLPNFTAPGLPFTSIGVVTNDGVGSIVYRANPVVGGQGAATTNLGVPVAGTYTVNSNCTGTATFPQGETYFFVIAEEGHELFIIGSALGTAITATARRQDAPAPRAQPPAGALRGAQTCSPGLLKGTFAFIAHANDTRVFPNLPNLPPGMTLPPQGIPLAGVGIEYWDGAGNAETLVEVDSAGGLILATDPQNPPPPTPFTVRADCSGTYRTPGGWDTTLVVLDGGRELRAVPTVPGFSGFIIWKKISDGKL